MSEHNRGLTDSEPAAGESPRRQRYVPAVGPRLKKLLAVVFGLFAVLAVNSIYLVSVRGLEAATGRTYQDWFYLVMFLLHVVLGLAIVLPVVIFGILHLKNARNRPNRRAVRVGYALFVTALVLLASGFVLTRIEGVIEVRDPAVRSTAYWLHVVTPLLAAWLFVLHRLAGKRIRWKTGLRWATVAGVFAVGMLVLHAQDPRRWNVEGPKEGADKYFFPSLARTSTGEFIPARVLQYDNYCQECHGDIHARWSQSAHRFSSFNNPAYLFAVRETRDFSMAKQGDVRRSRWCAGCHDTVPFFSGAFDDPEFDLENDPTGQAGLTCTTCHAITHVNSVRGNADYTIEEPQHYPFAFSENRSLAWVNRQLVKSKPDFHKRTFLKPLHRSAEFCSTCHKVHLPKDLNDYKFLRGQNHYDSFHLSGVSGFGVTSFYYPPKATENCAGCHMPLSPSDDFGSRDFDATGERKVHDHLFPAANTGAIHLVDLQGRHPVDKEMVVEAHRAFNQGVMRVDLFGLRRGGTVDGELIAPLRPEVPALVPGEPYLLETVVRTLKMGHEFTQGTVDSNEVWVRVAVTDGAGRRIGTSGGYGPDREVDRWSHFVNVYMLDREGNRINRRNPQDIFVPLYNHQIPPGAADALHYRLVVPPGTPGPVTVEAELRYRKFDTEYMRLVHEKEFKVPPETYVNELPVLTLATDRVVFPLAGAPAVAAAEASAPPAEPEWQRWNDYGIGLLRKGGKSAGELRQAEEAFAQVEALGRPDGPLNLARVYLAQGTVRDQAIAALARAAAFDPPAPRWSVAWFSGLVDKQNGYLDEAIASFRSIVELDDAETRERGFDFSKDYRLLVELGQTLVERSRQERGEARRAEREALLREAAGWFERALALDPENIPAHYNLNLIWRQLGDEAKAAAHFERWQTYKPDDNVRDRAIAIARAADPAADHAAEAIVIYDLHRPGAYELDGAEPAPPAQVAGPAVPEPAGEPLPGAPAS